MVQNEAKVDGTEVKVLERGHIYFIYQPKIEEENVSGMDDVQRTFMVLRPEGKKIYRVAIIGRKHLPDVSGRQGERDWGFVESVKHDAREVEQAFREQSYSTKTRGERHVPAARPAGEGVYVIASKGGDHTHFAYSLELPDKPGAAQKALNIAPEATYILAIKNPDKGQPLAAGLSEERKADYPKKLRETLRDLRFAPADPPDFLDYEGAEFVMIGVTEDVGEELGLDLPAKDESEASADIMRDLHMVKSRHPVEPLFSGDWA